MDRCLNCIHILSLFLPAHTCKIILGQYMFEISKIFWAGSEFGKLWTQVNSPKPIVLLLASFLPLALAYCFWKHSSNHNSLNYHIYKCTNKQWGVSNMSATVALVSRTTTGLSSGAIFPSHLKQNFTVAHMREVKRLNEGQWYHAIKSTENKTPNNLGNTYLSTWTFRIWFGYKNTVYYVPLF